MAHVLSKLIVFLILSSFLVGCIEEDKGDTVIVSSSSNNDDTSLPKPKATANNNLEGDECEYDSDCVWAQTTCCACTQGGEEVCVPWSKKAEVERTDKECKLRVICGGGDICKPPESCSCEDGYCK